MEHAKHIIRAVLLVVVIAVTFALVRHAMIPESYGTYGPYRADSLNEFAAQEAKHGALGSCNDCHDDQAEKLAEGKHGSVSCEVCHGPLAVHVKGDERIAEMPVRRSIELCAWCHERLIARPVDFQQVVIEDHVAEKGEEMREAVCLECHDAHNPGE